MKDIEHGDLSTSHKVVAANGSLERQDTEDNASNDNSESPMTEAANERGQWSSGVEFLLSCISMSVGLGNVWRFPYVAYENGGGAFMLPYLILLAIIGRPIYYLELIVGQFSGRNSIKMWKCVPAFKGLGFAQLFSVSYIAIFYNYLMGISLYYLFASFTSELPWTKCDPAWVDGSNYCEEHPNATSYDNRTWPELYYEKTVLNISSGLGDVNSMSWKLVLCLLGSWTLVFLSVSRSISSLGKVAYFTAIFPYAVLITLLIVSVLQDGAVDGIIFFIKPDFKKLLDPIVWYRAVEQSFFSLAVCFGSLVMYSSYNDFRNNVYRDAIIISVLDTLTSLMAGFVIFAVLGTMAKENGVEIKDVVKGGTGLAFIAYPEGLSKIKFIPQLWSVLFFIMLFVLGIGSSVAMIETVITCVKDQFSSLQKHKALTSLSICSVFFLLGLPLTTDAGSFIMQLLDNYGVGTAGFLYGIMEVCGIVWVYNINNFSLDMQFMLGTPPSWILKITWVVLTPLFLVVIFIYGNVLIFEKHVAAPGIPGWGTAIGWGLAIVALVQIPLWMVYTIWRQKGNTFKEKFAQAFSPTKDWGPVDEKLHQEWTDFKKQHTKISESGFSSRLNVLNSLGLQPEKKNKVLFRGFKKAHENLAFEDDDFPSKA